MKTREEFVLLANAYRKEWGWRSSLIFTAFIFVFIASFAIAILASHLAMNPRVRSWISVTLWFAPGVFLIFYKVKSKESLARKLELVCPSCSRALMNDLKLATATHNCPYCGNPVFS
jgi:ribosomal protein S27AE